MRSFNPPTIGHYGIIEPGKWITLVSRCSTAGLTDRVFRPAVEVAAVANHATAVIVLPSFDLAHSLFGCAFSIHLRLVTANQSFWLKRIEKDLPSP